jgi:hypothetical protein
MAIHIDDKKELEKARRRELERLTGCEVHRIIDGTCQEPGCKNQGIMVNNLLMDEETCKRLQEVVIKGQMDEPEKSTLPPANLEPPEPIIQTTRRLRCVL